MKNNHRKINFYTQRQPFAVRVLLLIAVSLASGIPNVSATSEANQESSLPSPSRRQQQPERNVGGIFQILKSLGESNNVIQQGEASDAEDAQKIIEQWLDQALKTMIDEMIQKGQASNAEDAQKIIEQGVGEYLERRSKEMIQEGKAADVAKARKIIKREAREHLKMKVNEMIQEEQAADVQEDRQLSR